MVTNIFGDVRDNNYKLDEQREMVPSMKHPLHAPLVFIFSLSLSPSYLPFILIFPVLTWREILVSSLLNLHMVLFSVSGWKAAQPCKAVKDSSKHARKCLSTMFLLPGRAWLKGRGHSAEADRDL